MPKAAIVVTLRERYSCGPSTLRVLLARTPEWAEIVYVACGASQARIQELKAHLGGRQGTVVEGPDNLPQNEARNLGARHASAGSDWLVFIDNDVIVDDGWLEALVGCALETGAAIVGPLIQEGDPAQRIVHMSGGVYREIETPNGRVAFERHINAHRPISSLKKPLARSIPDYVEGHCLLISKRAFDLCSGWNERLVTMCEYIDLCLRVRDAGLTIAVEPRSVVTYGKLDGMTVEDVPLFLKRWDIEATRATYDTFAASRALRPDSELIAYGHSFVRDHRGWLRLFDSGPDWAKTKTQAQSSAPGTWEDLCLSLRHRGVSISGCEALDWLGDALDPHLTVMDRRHASFWQIGLRAAHLLAADGGHVALLAGAVLYPILRSGGVSTDAVRTLIAGARRPWEFDELHELLNGMFNLERALPGAFGPQFMQLPAAHLRQAAVLAALAGAQGPAMAQSPVAGVLGLLTDIGFSSVSHANVVLAQPSPPQGRFAASL